MSQSWGCVVPGHPREDYASLYEQFGEDCVHHLYQDFAFVLYNPLKEEWFAARDPVGLRPLYYTQNSGEFKVASNIGELLESAGVPLRPNLRAVENIACNSTMAYSETMYEGVKRLPPGHYLKVNRTGAFELVRYWRPESIEINRHITRKEAVAEFRRLFDQAIEDCIDDLGTTGFELSGGLDSSSIVAWQSKKYPKRSLRCYSMTFDSLADCDESEYLAAMKQHCNLNVLALKSDTLDYEKALSLDYNYSLNPHWPIFITYTMGLPLVEKAKAMGTKTILTGQGGDNVTQGTPYGLHDYFRQFRWVNLVRELSAAPAPWSLFKRFVLFPALGKRGAKLVSRVRHPFRSLSDSAGASRSTNAEQYSDLYQGTSLAFRISLAQLVHSNISALLENSYYQVARDHYGVEFKHPFFDRRLMEFMLSLPPEYKLFRGRSKYILRRAMEGVLPEKVRQRSTKADFTEVLRQQIDALDLDSLLDDAEIARLGVIDQEEVHRLKADYRQGKFRGIIHFWQIVNLEYWYRFNWHSAKPITVRAGS